MLVTLPEETPVNELVETAYSLEDQVGVSLGPVVVNGLYPEIAGPRRRPEAAAADGRRRVLRPGEADVAGRAPAEFRRHRDGTCRPSRSPGWPSACRCRSSQLPFLFDADLGPAELDVLADALLDGIAALDATRWPVPRRRRAAWRAVTDRSGRRAVDLVELVDTQRDHHLLGSGGVGKTTTAAVLALEAARQGRRAVRRHHRPGQAPGRRARPRGHRPTRRRRIDGDLARRAVGADARHQVDVRRPRDASTRRRRSRPSGILDNRFYRNISGALSGTQEYMAMEKLYELHDERRLRPGRRRHAADPQRARLPRRARAGSPASSTTASSGC